MQPARANGYRGTPGDVHIFCRHQFQAASAQVHYPNLCWSTWFSAHLVGRSVEGERSFSISADDLHGESCLALNLLKKAGTVTGLANRFGRHDKYGVRAIFLRQCLVPVQYGNRGATFLL